jgi:hypothetical protein
MGFAVPHQKWHINTHINQNEQIEIKKEVTAEDSRKDAYIAMLEERAELLRVALEFYSNQIKPYIPALKGGVLRFEDKGAI